MSLPRFSSRRAHRGFTYGEVMLSVVLLAIMLVPALDALQSAIAGTPVAAATANVPSLASKAEEVLATPFSKVYAETYAPGGNTAASASALFSDPAGTPDRRVVVLYRYDALLKSLSVADTGLVYVNVYHESSGAAAGLHTLVGRWW